MGAKLTGIVAAAKLLNGAWSEFAEGERAAVTLTKLRVSAEEAAKNAQMLEGIEWLTGDKVSAANLMGRALNGLTRELKAYGIEIAETATREQIMEARKDAGGILKRRSRLRGKRGEEAAGLGAEVESKAAAAKDSNAAAVKDAGDKTAAAVDNAATAAVIRQKLAQKIAEAKKFRASVEDAEAARSAAGARMAELEPRRESEFDAGEQYAEQEKKVHALTAFLESREPVLQRVTLEIHSFARDEAFEAIRPLLMPLLAPIQNAVGKRLDALAMLFSDRAIFESARANFFSRTSPVFQFVHFLKYAVPNYMSGSDCGIEAAETAASIIDRILAGEAVWQFEEKKTDPCPTVRAITGTAPRKGLPQSLRSSSRSAVRSSTISRCYKITFPH